ncbi:MAG: glycine zipper 2TM domain-containing protein [Pseudomonadota bacterium]
MNKFLAMIVVSAFVFAGPVSAGSKSHGHKSHAQKHRSDLYEYAKVVDVQPIYREVRVSSPIRECWDEPVYHTQHQHHKSAGGMLAGGLIGGIIGHQIGKGNGNKVATAVGTLIGAQIGHEAVNGDHKSHRQSRELAGYEEVCKTRHRVSYEEVVDGYDVTYKYRGKRYHIEMPYDPGKRIKMRIQFTPVI